MGLVGRLSISPAKVTGVKLLINKNNISTETKIFKTFLFIFYPPWINFIFLSSFRKLQIHFLFLVIL